MDPGLRRGDELVERWEELRKLRFAITSAIEPKRRDKELGSSLEAMISISLSDPDDLELATSANLSEIAIVADTSIVTGPAEVTVTRTTHHKCGRCWRHLPEVTDDNALCSRCDNVVGAMEGAL